MGSVYDKVDNISVHIFCAVRLKFEICVIFVVADILILLFVFFGSFEILTDYVY